MQLRRRHMAAENGGWGLDWTPLLVAHHASVTRNKLDPTLSDNYSSFHTRMSKMASQESSKAKLDQEAINLTASQAATTAYSGSRAEMQTDDGSDRASRASMYTYTSGDANHFKKEEDGRLWNILNNSYFMPTDDEEWARLNKQHVALVLGLGDLYPEPETVRAILAPVEGETKRILDLGCGSGVWTIAMAKKFPHAQVIGVDLAPTPVDMDSLPPNCSFEIDDINPGLPHYEGKFDIVHCRIIGAGLQDRVQAKTFVQECLKPGGMLIWMDVDYDLIAENMDDYEQRASEKHAGGSWCARMLYDMSQAVLSASANDLTIMGDIIDEGFWADPLMDPETCRTASLYIPVGPWVEDRIPEQLQRLRYMGALMRQDVSNGVWTFHPLLKRAGFREETLKEWSTKADAEMANLTTRMWSRWMVTWGRRRSPDAGPAPGTTPVNSKDEHFAAPYPYLVCYSSRDEALAASMRRRQLRAAIPSVL